MFQHSYRIARQKLTHYEPESAGALSGYRIECPSFDKLRLHKAHTMFQTLQDLHLLSYIESLTFRYKFVVHSFMAIKKTRSTWLLFLLCSSKLYVAMAYLSFSTPCSATSIWCPIHKSKFRRGDDPFQEFIAAVWSFPINATFFFLSQLLRSQ